MSRRRPVPTERWVGRSASRRRAVASALLGLLAGTASALLGILATTGPDQPSCPTEDSCSVDYRDGAWHIEETTP